MKKNTKNLLIIVGVIGFVFIITSGFTYAKYVKDAIWNYYLNSNGFYFSSPDLSISGEKNINNNWDGESTSFTISNSLNDSLISERDIKYKVTCTVKGESAEYATCRLMGTESDEYEGTLSTYAHCSNDIDDTDVSIFSKNVCESNGYKWVQEKTSKELYFDIVELTETKISELEVEIKAESISPYSKVLIGDYILSRGISKVGSLDLKYKSYDNYDNLIVSNTYEEDKCLKLSWNSEDLRIDIDTNQISSYQTDENGYINEIVFKLNRNNSKSHIFYKTDFNAVYTENNFTLVENDEC